MTHADALTSSLTIEVLGVALAEPEALAEVLKRITYNHHTAKQITIACRERKSDGWLEYVVHVQYAQGSMTIGAIQRTPGAEMEFHS